MTRQIKGHGPLNAKLAIIGEAPGKWEDQHGKPFMGPSGNLLDRWLRDANIDTKQVYYDNVIPRVLLGSRLESISIEEIDHYAQDILSRLARLSNLNLVAAVGNLALYALTGLVKPQLNKNGSWGWTSPGIGTYRGSIYSFDGSFKVIPTIHPAAIIYSAGGATREENDEGFKKTIPWEKRCRADWRKISREMHSKELPTRKRAHVIDPSEHNIKDFMKELGRKTAPILAIDIETNPKAGHILCVGFSFNPTRSITIPWNGSWRKEWIKKLCEHPCDKALQNGHYDAYWLAQEGIDIINFRYDTMLMHHALDPIDEHSLHYISSLYTNEPYWKDEGKYDTKTGVHRDWDQLLAYCGKDACITRELVEELVEELGYDGTAFYFNQSQALISPILEIMLHGVRVDTERMSERHAELKAEALSLRDQLTEANDGEPPFKLTGKRDKLVYAVSQLFGTENWEALLGIAKSKNKYYSKEEIQKSLDTIQAKSISNQELMAILYDKFNLPKQRKLRKTTGERTPSVDAIALRTLRLRYGSRNEQAAKILDLAIEFAKVKKLSEFYNTKGVDEDERMRCSYKIGGTETGRLSSAKNPKGTGTNLQNRARSTRDIFVPDHDCVFLEVDLSQAEDRVVKALAYSITGNEDLLDRANARPEANDEHKRAARSIYQVALEEVTKNQRQHAKQVRHGLNYDMGSKTMSDGFLKEGIVYTPAECQHMKNLLSKADPEIKEWQAWTRNQIIRNRTLTNSWGATWNVPYERLDNNLYRRGYAFVPQSEVGRLINSYGLVPLAEWLRLEYIPVTGIPRPLINLQVHDSLVISCAPQDIYDVAKFLKNSLERPRTYNGIEVTIPCEYAIGFNWNKAEMHEWKELPSSEEMTDVAFQMAKKVSPF